MKFIILRRLSQQDVLASGQTSPPPHEMIEGVPLVVGSRHFLLYTDHGPHGIEHSHHVYDFNI